LPPPLVGEGEKVQPDWLYQFLMDPHRIRPAAVLRMPKFTLSPTETQVLVDYFAAVDGAPYPFEFEEQKQQSYLVSVEKERPRHMDDALAIILNRNYCIQCHSVADFVPAGRPVALAPNLGEAYRRLRPEWLRNWIANPKRLLPYTGMPVNIPYDKGIPQELYAGDSTEQLNALVDFLMNFDRYAEKQLSIQAMVPPASPETDSQAGN